MGVHLVPKTLATFASLFWLLAGWCCVPNRSGDGGVEGLLQNLKLSEEEKKSIKIASGSRVAEGEKAAQAVAKLLSEKAVRPEIIE